MFKAILLVCSLVHGSGDEKSCFQLEDTMSPNGYATEEQCMVRIDEMVELVRSLVMYPHIVKYKCESNMRSTNDRKR
jgi:hypothetical protein